jgi:hypothetical protein
MPEPVKSHPNDADYRPPPDTATDEERADYNENWPALHDSAADWAEARRKQKERRG